LQIGFVSLDLLFSAEDLQLYIFHGLSIDYDSLIVSLNSKAGDVPFNELAGLLLTHEQRIQKHALTTAAVPSSVSIPASLTPIHSIPQVNLVTSPFTSDSSVSSDDTLFTQFQAFLASKGQSWRARTPHKSSSPSADFSDKPMCQLCSKRGHTADRCYKRFDYTYKPPPPRPPPRY
jgi:hypothetical protein